MNDSEKLTPSDKVYSKELYKNTCINASNMCKLYSRDDQTKHIWALNKIRNTFSL